MSEAVITSKKISGCGIAARTFPAITLGIVILLMAVLAPFASAATCPANDLQCQQHEESERQRKMQEQKAEQQQREQAEQQQQARLQELREQLRDQQQRDQQLRDQQQREQQQRQQPQHQPEQAAPTRQPQPQPQPQPQAQPLAVQPPSYHSQIVQKPTFVTDANISRVQMNITRNNYAGINRQPIPEGRTESLAHGGIRVSTNDGRQLIFRSNGTLATFNGAGVTATLFTNGQIRSIQTESLQVRRTANGARTVVLQMPGHTVVVSTGPQRGYVQKEINWRGRSVTQRTFVSNGTAYSRLYGSSTYHGLRLLFYIPVVYYNPYYYGWAYFPWAAPVYYNWGWSASPWYLANNGYFSTYSYYLTPSMWMTDQMLGNMMQSSYDLQQTADQNGDDAPPDLTPDYTSTDDALPDPVYAPVATPITPELKQAIADQVAQQVLLENAVAQNPQSAATLSGLPRALQPNQLFIVSQILNVAGGNAQSCALTPGDVLQLVATPSTNAITADLTVNASRQGDCPTGMVVSIALTDLQEMQNEFHYQVDRSLQSLNALQGQQGIPRASAAAYNPPPQVTGLPPPVNDAALLIQGAQQQADESEAQLSRMAFGN